MSFKNKKKHRVKNFGGSEKLDKLAEAAFLIEGGQWSEALRFLEDSTQKYPSDTGFWELLAEVASRLEDVPNMQRAFGRLVMLSPNHADASYWLAYSYGLDGRLGLAYRGFKAFVARFPDDDKCAEATELLKMAESDLQKTIAGYGFPEGNRGIELLCLNDESQILMRQGDLVKAREKAEKLIGLMPDYAPAYNNLSLAFYLDGEVEKAYETACSILAKQPENFHALANLVRFSVYLGKVDEARQFADRLLPAKGNDPDIWIKKIEAFTYIGDDQSVVDVYNEAVKKTRSARPDSFGKHLAAYAYYRLGQEKDAQKLWRKILKDDPDFDFAIENLAELKLPEGKRSVVGLPLPYWIPERFVNELTRETTSVKDGKKFEKNLRNKIAAFFAKHPSILNLFSVFLERGDETSRNFAVRLLDLAGTPEANAALRDFAFSQSGSDKLRYKTAMQLADAGVIPNSARLWNGDEWREMRLMTFEITSEPVETYPMKPKAEQLYRKGYYALQDQKLELAEQYLDMALEANGADHPSIMFNLLVVEQLRGNFELVEGKLREIVKDFPDYSFGAITLAGIEVKHGNIEAATQMTERFYDKKVWHMSEICAWLHFNVELAIEKREYASARISLEMWQKLDEDLDYEFWESRISRLESLGKLPLFRQVYGKKVKMGG